MPLRAKADAAITELSDHINRIKIFTQIALGDFNHTYIFVKWTAKVLPTSDMSCLATENIRSLLQYY